MTVMIEEADGLDGEAYILLDGSAAPFEFIVPHIFVRYTTAGPPTGQRQVRITAELEGGRVIAITGGDTQPVNTTRYYTAYPLARLERVPTGDDIQWLPWPEGLTLPHRSVIRAKGVLPSGGPTVNDTVQLRVQFTRIRAPNTGQSGT